MPGPFSVASEGENVVIYCGLWVAFLVLLPVGVSMNRGKRK